MESLSMNKKYKVKKIFAPVFLGVIALGVYGMIGEGDLKFKIASACILLGGGVGVAHFWGTWILITQNAICFKRFCCSRLIEISFHEIARLKYFHTSVTQDYVWIHSRNSKDRIVINGLFEKRFELLKYIVSKVPHDRIDPALIKRLEEHPTFPTFQKIFRFLFRR